MQSNEENSMPSMENADPVIKDRLSRLKSGCLLLALDSLKDPNFDSTVVLICVQSKKDGAYGLILNRPTHMPLSEVFDGFSDMDIKRKLYMGGPVSQNVLQVLQQTESPQKDAYLVAPKVYMGGQWDDLANLITSEEPGIRLFLGYSGWAPGQLEFEIMADAWEVFNVDVGKLLQDGEERLPIGIEAIKEYLNNLR